MIFATDDIGMGILLNPALAKSAGNDDGWPWGTKEDPVGFTPCYETIKKAIHAEIWNTELIRMHGYEVDSILTAFHAATPDTYCQVNGNPGDMLYDKKYYGANIHPYETIFVKANRGIDPVLLENMTRWHLSQNSTSWDSCVKSN